MNELTIQYLHCNECNKQVSTGFYPLPTVFKDNKIVIRAWIQCLECIENKPDRLLNIMTQNT